TEEEPGPREHGGACPAGERNVLRTLAFRGGNAGLCQGSPRCRDTMSRPRVLLADDHTLMMEGLRKLLEGTCELVGTVEDGLALVDAAQRLHRDLILLDIPMPKLGELSPRQREVLQLVAEGRSIKEIAGLLKISSKTVEFHKSRIMAQLDLHTTAELTKYAITHGLVSL